MGFVIHWHESAMELHVFPIPIPPPTSLSSRFLWAFPVHQARALVSCIPPGLVICFTIDNTHVSMLFSWNSPPLPSPWCGIKSLLNVYNTASVCVLVFWLWGMRDLIFPTRGQTGDPWIKRQSLNHWLTRQIHRHWFKSMAKPCSQSRETPRKDLPNLCQNGLIWRGEGGWQGGGWIIFWNVIIIIKWIRAKTSWTISVCQAMFKRLFQASFYLILKSKVLWVTLYWSWKIKTEEVKLLVLNHLLVVSGRAGIQNQISRLYIYTINAKYKIDGLPRWC